MNYNTMNNAELVNLSSSFYLNRGDNKLSKDDIDELFKEVYNRKLYRADVTFTLHLWAYNKCGYIDDEPVYKPSEKDLSYYLK